MKGPPTSKQTYKLPEFLAGRITREKYISWLQRKAQAHVKRDRLRLKRQITLADYKMSIHLAVESSNGKDWYTGEELAWEKISTYDNADSKSHRAQYKTGFSLLPTVDHVITDRGDYDVVICSWRMNGAKSDLSLADFLTLCRKVISLHGQ